MIVLTMEDDKFISCGLSSGARFIVNGDRGLFGLKNYENILILKPYHFLKLFEKGRPTGA